MFIFKRSHLGLPWGKVTFSPVANPFGGEEETERVRETHIQRQETQKYRDRQRDKKRESK